LFLFVVIGAFAFVPWEQQDRKALRNVNREVLTFEKGSSFAGRSIIKAFAQS